MRNALLVVAFVSGFALYAYAQTTQPTADALTIEADTISRLIPVQDIGAIKAGRPNVPFTATGNVVIAVNGMRVTADMAVWHTVSNQLELNSGSARIELPDKPTGFGIRQRSRGVRQ